MNAPPRQRGFLLPGALALLLVVSASGALLLARSRAMLQSSQTSDAALQAIHAASGGVETARAVLRRDPGWGGAPIRVGSHDVGSYDVVVRVTRSGRLFRVESSAGSVRLAVELDPVPDAPPRVVSWRRSR